MDTECVVYYCAENFKRFFLHAVIIVPLNQFYAHLFVVVSNRFLKCRVEADMVSVDVTCKTCTDIHLFHQFQTLVVPDTLCRGLCHWLDPQGLLYYIHLHNLMQSNTTAQLYKAHNVQFLLTIVENFCKFDLFIAEVGFKGGVVLDYIIGRGDEY